MKIIASKITLVLVLLIGFIGTIIWLSNSRDRAIRQRNLAITNLKAYELRLSNRANEVRELQLTIDQLNYSQDSIIQRLMETKNELRIKNRDLQRLEYVSSSFERIDTIYTTDTLFVRDMRLDTVVGDQWMNTHVILSYPSEISVKSTARSEKHVLVHSVRETVNPPKKFFLCRWFQKKHTVIKVEVIEKNPYIKSTENVFVSTIR